MKLFAPKYYNKFSCIGSLCRHSCCIGWDVTVDEKCIKDFEKLGGTVAKRFSDSLVSCEGNITIKMCDDGRCPHLLPSGLCSIISKVGDKALPEICREHPRFYNVFGDHVEVGLGAVCEVAAELIIAGCDYNSLFDIGEVETDCGVNEYGLSKRSDIFNLLSGKDDNNSKVKKVLLKIDTEGVLDNFSYDVFCELEYLDDANKSIITTGLKEPIEITDEGINILSYFIYRHASCACDKNDFASLVIFSIISMKCVLGMARRGISLSEALRIYSLEIEYSTDNTEEILFEIDCSLL